MAVVNVRYDSKSEIPVAPFVVTVFYDSPTNPPRNYNKPTVGEAYAFADKMLRHDAVARVTLSVILADMRK